MTTAAHPFLSPPKATPPRPPVYNASSHGYRGASLYVGRRTFTGQRRGLAGHPLANPFKLIAAAKAGGRSRLEIEQSGRAECLARYRHWLYGIPALPILIGHLRRTWLDGQRTHGRAFGLLCWCAPKACHADTLADLVAMTDFEVAAMHRPAAHEGESLFRSVWLGETALAQPLADWLIDRNDPRGELLAAEVRKRIARHSKQTRKDDAKAAEIAAPFQALLGRPGVTGTIDVTVRTGDPKDDEFRRFVGRLMETDPNTWGGVVNKRLRPFAFPVAIWPGEKDETGDDQWGRPKVPAKQLDLSALAHEMSHASDR